jgi:hypothetical protein
MGQASMGTNMGAARGSNMGAATSGSGNSMGGGASPTMTEDQMAAVPMVPGYSVIRFKANNPGKRVYGLP